jgi:SnoaL-like domain
MPRIIPAALIAMLLAAAVTTTAAAEEEKAYVSRAESTPEDSAAIMQLTKDFSAAVINKNPRQLSALLVNSDILFTSPMPAEDIKMVNERYDVNFNGIGSGGFTEFARFIGMSPKPVEEKFYNIKITQDANVAWVIFDFEFLLDGKTENYGVETWQVMKGLDGKWKILSVVWSSHFNRPE